MRWVVLILGLAGSGGAGALGYLWRSDLDQHRGLVDMIRREGKAGLKKERVLQSLALEVDSKHKASYFLMAGAVLGIIGSILALARRGILAGLLMLLAWIGPGVLTWEWLLSDSGPPGATDSATRILGYFIFTGALLLAGLLAFLIRPKKVVPEDERAYAGV